MSDPKENTQGSKNNLEIITDWLSGRDYLLALGLSSLLLILGAGIHIDILGAKAQPSNDNFNGNLLLYGSAIFFVVFLYLRNRKDPKKQNSNASNLEVLQKQLKEIADAGNLSETEQQSLDKLDPLLSKLHDNKITERFVADWLRNSFPEDWLRNSVAEETWVDRVLNKTIQECKIIFEDETKKDSFRKDIEQYLEDILCSLETGDEPRYSGSKSMGEKIPYVHALEVFNVILLDSYERYSTVPRRRREKGKAFLEQTVRDLTMNLEDHL